MKNTKYNIDGFAYEVGEGLVRPKDYMIVNNPHPQSSLKNVLRRCDSLHSNGSIQSEQGGLLVMREWAQKWCKRVVWSDNPTVQAFIESQKTND